MPKILMSACLYGKPCRYDGCAKAHPLCCAFPQDDVVLVCPEELGGLPTPRIPSEIQGDKVINAQGEDVTHAYQRGAQKTLAIAQENRISLAILKAKSPSCGCGKIYDGTFTKTLKEGDGITTQLLKRHHIQVFNEEDLEQGKIKLD